VRPTAEVRIDSHGEWVVAAVEGEVDLANIDEVRALLVVSIAGEHRGVVLDLSATRYLDSTGVRLLFDLADRLESRRQELRMVVTPASIIRRVVDLTRLDARVGVYDDVATALDGRTR
jgi:stage II sporulation protein AA (anti-sigma F factor antagonist)